MTRVGTVTENGEVTIPADIREQVGLKPQDRVVFEADGDEIRIRSVRSMLLAGYGSVTPFERPENWRRIRRQFEDDVAANVVAETE
jgi:AbrB family looped-hinge helix DNA binding protein